MFLLAFEGQRENDPFFSSLFLVILYCCYTPYSIQLEYLGWIVFIYVKAYLFRWKMLCVLVVIFYKRCILYQQVNQMESWFGTAFSNGAFYVILPQTCTMSMKLSIGFFMRRYRSRCCVRFEESISRFRAKNRRKKILNRSHLSKVEYSSKKCETWVYLLKMIRPNKINPSCGIACIEIFGAKIQLRVS